MNASDIILILDALMWLLIFFIPFLVVIVVVSCLVRNRVHLKQHDLIEKTAIQQFTAFNETGHWPTPETLEQRKAMAVLARRLDVQNSRLPETY
jgi:hypothetical protein